METCKTCGRKYNFVHFCIQPEGPYPEYNQDRAILAEVVRMNRDRQCTLFDVLPQTAVKHLERLASNVPQPGPCGCDEEVTA